MDTREITDRARWSDAQHLRPEWEPRSRFAADLIPGGSAVLDLGCGAMTLERYLPPGCSYLPCDFVRRDERTTVCDFNRGEFPGGASATLITVLGVLEYIEDVPAFLQRLCQYNLPVLISYCPRELTSHLDRVGLGWLNHLSVAELEQHFREAGLTVSLRLRIDPIQGMFRLTPGAAPAAREKSVLVLSYNNVGNFGDRLGFHLINECLPVNACVTHAHFNPWDVPEARYDLVIVGIGNSIFAPLLSDNLFALLEKSSRAVGIFGTQYRHAIDTAKMSALLDRLDIWYARYEEDALLYGRGRNHVVHMGDWLINAFPMARGTRPELLKVGDEVWNDLPLDRVIQRIQSFGRVYSTRLHPLLGALTSAGEVAYVEQRGADGAVSGKFRSMLLDVFGRTWPENQYFQVSRDAVALYKAKARQRSRELSARLDDVLNAG